MALTNAYVLATNRISDLFSKIRDGQAPDRFTHQLLKDWGFRSTNDRAFIPLLKALGFLSAEGKPTQRYHNYRDHSQSKVVMADALRETYSDIFLIKEHPTASDKSSIEGKFKSFHNVSENVSGLMTKTFFSLLTLADISTQTKLKETSSNKPHKQESELPPVDTNKLHTPSLHYNIQIHLPATKDIEVYNAIFHSLRRNILDA